MLSKSTIKGFYINVLKVFLIALSFEFCFPCFGVMDLVSRVGATPHELKAIRHV